jgi:AcrR family transcriptional regulator
MPTVASRSSSPTPRRSQAERRAATRARLLEATVACLVEDGATGATTTAVGKRAGLSQGAIFTHFSTKADLIAAAVAVLFDDLIEDFQRALVAAADDRDPVRAAVDALWAVFRSERIAAAFEIYVAARTDSGLADALAPVAAAHHGNIRAEARILFPRSAADDPERFDATVDLVIAALQGAALAAGALALPAGHELLLDRLTELVRDAVRSDTDPVH